MVSVGTMKQTVTLLKQVKLDGVWKRYPVVLNRNGSIKPDYVLVAGKPMHAADGNYVLDWYEGGKRMRQSVGKDAADALLQRDRKVAELTAASNGLVVQNGDPTKHLLADAAESYLADIKAHKSSKTLSAYTTALRYFRESCKKTYVEDIDRRDLLAFKTYSRTRRNNPTAASGISSQPSWGSLSRSVTKSRASGSTTGLTTTKRLQRYTKTMTW
jgi:hypothetical protein